MKYRPREATKKTKRIAVNVTESDHQFIKILATDNYMTISRFILKAIKHYLKTVLDVQKDIESEKE